MTASIAKVRVVEIDGIWFRIQRYRCRRSTRGAALLNRLFGAASPQMLASPEFQSMGRAAQVSLFSRLVKAAETTGGHASDPDEVESVFSQLLEWTSANRGEGVCYSPEELDPHGDGWAPVRSLATLDAFDTFDWTSSTALIWELFELNYVPTTAGPGTSAATGPATATTPAAKSPSTPTPGGPSTPTQSLTGVSGG